jgi:fumarate hydratase class II
VAAADEVLPAARGEFPLVVWQTGSGTQTNMNVNEVLANRASELLGGQRGEGGWCTRTTTSTRASRPTTSIPTAMHMAAVDAIRNKLLPSLAKLRETLAPSRRPSATS